MNEDDPMDLYGTNADSHVDQEEKKKNREIDVLKSKSKPLHELVQMVNFRIDDVLATIIKTSYSSDETGIFHNYAPKLILNGVPDDLNIATRILTFEGFSIIKAGDYVSAKIPRYDKKTIYSERKVASSWLPHWENFYIDREFKIEEVAIELAIRFDKSILRSDRAGNYDDFFKQ